MKKLLLIGILAFFGCESSNTQSAQSYETNEPKITTEAKYEFDSLPKNFILQAEFLTIGTDMDIYDENDNYYGVVEERTLNLTRTFELYDSEDKKIAKAQKRFFSWGTKIDVTDPSGKHIGSIEKQVFDNFFSVYSKYKIFDANHRCLANSDKLDVITSNVYIDGTGVSVNMHQEYFSLTDTWETKVKGDIDKRLIVFIPAFISAEQKVEKDKEEK